MAIRLQKMQKKNPQNQDMIKWYLTHEKVGTVGMKEISAAIGKRSSLSSGDVQSALRNLVELMPTFLKIGHSINLEGFGIFRISVNSEGMDTAEELHTSHVKKVKILFLPSVELKRNLEDISFEIIDTE
ncbi:MAG: hypothetical protein LBU99_00675 [Spirochaetaceae bacterium]|jgi:predicted histone-like DNA-binding protein|nr:hypothetical protein [Spirochaetaceae bacterium]